MALLTQRSKSMRKAPQKANPRAAHKVRVDTVSICRKKANAWGKGDGKEVRDALFHYLLIRARCQRTGDSEVLDLANSGLKIYAWMAKQSAMGKEV